MGLSAFNRARRSMLEESRIEVERFKKDNEARWRAHHGVDKIPEDIESDLEEIRAANAKGVQLIGEKTREGIKSGEEGGVIDLPLRKDHAAEIAGRIMQNTQEDIDLMERLEARIPSGGTANEELAEHTQVDQDGPTPELVQAALNEATGEATGTFEETKRSDAQKAEAMKEAKAEMKSHAEQEKARVEEKEKAQEGLPEAGKSAGAGTEAPSSSSTTAAKPTASSKTAAPKK